MKKVIPQKVANKVYDKLLAENQNRVEGEWPEEFLFKPGTNKVSNRFYKNSVRGFIYKCSCDWCYRGKLASTRRKIEKLKCDLNDYLQTK